MDLRLETRAMLTVLAASLAFMGSLPGCLVEGNRPARLLLATTTSTDNSGLLEHLLPPFEKETGIPVHVIAVGTGQALSLGERGDVDLLLVHAREREDRFVAAGHGSERRDIMWNDFIILGPADDAAGVRGISDAAAALAQIVARDARFLSRGDDSGTHIREQELWAVAGGVPRGSSFYIETGQGMGSTLVMADEKRAYVLADRGTWLAFARRLDLEIMVEGDPRLRNPYGAILVDPGSHQRVQADAARRLLDYLTSSSGQERIGAFRIDGRQLFHPALSGT